MDIHVLTGHPKRGECEIIFHFPVPDTNNSVGTNHRTALVNSGLGGSTQMTEGSGPGQIATAEKTQIEAGEVFEQRITFSAEGDGKTLEDVNRMLQRKYTREKTLKLAELQARLKYFGHTESES